MVVVLDQKLHPNQTVYVLVDARAVLDSSGKPFVVLAGSDFNFAVAEQVTVPKDTVTFPACPTTTLVISFAELVQHTSFRIAFRCRAEVLCGKNTLPQYCNTALPPTTTIPRVHHHNTKYSVFGNVVEERMPDESNRTIRCVDRAGVDRSACHARVRLLSDVEPDIGRVID